MKTWMTSYFSFTTLDVRRQWKISSKCHLKIVTCSFDLEIYGSLTFFFFYLFFFYNILLQVHFISFLIDTQVCLLFLSYILEFFACFWKKKKSIIKGGLNKEIFRHAWLHILTCCTIFPESIKDVVILTPKITPRKKRHLT